MATNDIRIILSLSSSIKVIFLLFFFFCDAVEIIAERFLHIEYT